MISIAKSTFGASQLDQSPLQSRQKIVNLWTMENFFFGIGDWGVAVDVRFETVYIFQDQLIQQDRLETSHRVKSP